MLAGWIEVTTGNIALAWSLTFYLTAALFIGLTAWHGFVLPRPSSDTSGQTLSPGKLAREFAGTFSSFFRKGDLGLILFFLLTYRLGESQLVKIVSPFLLDFLAKWESSGRTTGAVSGSQRRSVRARVSPWRRY